MTKKSLSLVFVEVTAENLESVEIVDGSTRKLAVKSIVQNFFRETFMIIMNVDEIAAHGYILMCAILCSTVKVKEFKFQDCHVYPIILSWQRGVNEVRVFSRWNVIPSTKIFSFYK
ncbi:unnamed protein product [Rotaria sordida]|uniref:Uncharacterized protein n=1 Tax=Rotaria sordida TaxID=392033 RepID=A0A815Y5K3_9BILA|nr:unnamed protein product [Rotaria sordida]CAF4092423.1 unnamed protein product [Rotaria sordida]